MKAVDLSHLDCKQQLFYDIESTGAIFTNTFLNDDYCEVWMLDDGRHDFVSNEDIQDAIVKRWGKKSAITLVRATTKNLQSVKQLLSRVFLVLSGKSLDAAHPGFCTYCGWNSARYDLRLLELISLLGSPKAELCTAPAIRALSNAIIAYDGKPWEIDDYFAVTLQSLGVATTPSSVKLRHNSSVWTDAHVDIAALARALDAGNESQFPPALKREMAKFGLSIVLDDAVADDDESTIFSKQELLNLLSYNCNDVVGTQAIAHNPVIIASLATRDSIRKMYPWTSAKAMPLDKLNKYTPCERDCTAAKLAGEVLVGEKRIRPVDYNAVDYSFPVPGPNDTQHATDLLEYMRDVDHMPDLLYQFFAHFRGKDTRWRRDLKAALDSQPITHGAMMNYPYTRNGEVTDSYIRVSTGGAHGSLMAGLRNMQWDEIVDWIKSDAGAPPSSVPTVDAHDVVHIDWSSFYPVMASKMKLYETSEGIDRYTDIIRYRFKIKASLPHDPTLFTPEHFRMQEDQMGLKFILNNATGAGNMHSQWALLPLDNKTLSMRLVGNMHIWCLAQRLTDAGAMIVSTNTDGVYAVNITVEEAQRIIDGYVKDYGMKVDPEHVDRFINRDTSNRIEMLHGDVTDLRGRLRAGKTMDYDPDTINRSMAYPQVVAHAAVCYMTEDEDWLKKPYDKERMLSILQRLAAASPALPWCHIYSGTASRQLLVDDEPQQKVNRVIFTTTGKSVSQRQLRALSKTDAYQQWSEDTSLRMLIEVADKQYTPLDTRQPLSSEEFSEVWKAHKCKGVGKCVKGEWQLIKDWRVTKIPGYTADKVQLLNNEADLANFDMSTLDLNAYLAWSEQLLQGWKITADIPDLNMTQCDDTVIAKSTHTRLTKKDIELQKIRSLYDRAKD